MCMTLELATLFWGSYAKEIKRKTCVAAIFITLKM